MKNAEKYHMTQAQFKRAIAIQKFFVTTRLKPKAATELFAPFERRGPLLTCLKQDHIWKESEIEQWEGILRRVRKSLKRKPEVVGKGAGRKG